LSVLAAIAAAAIPLGVSSRAEAQPTAAIAEQLFRDGRALIGQGKFDEACEKFAASQRLAPAIGTLLNLAVCREKQGRDATAWSLYADAEAQAQRAGDKARATFAHDHQTAITPKLKKVVIDLPAPPAGAVVKLDGVALPPGALGVEIPLDPGDHDLQVTAPGKKTWSQPKLSTAADTVPLRVRVDLQDEPPPAPPPEPVVVAPAPPLPPSPETGPTTASSDEIERASRVRVRRIAGLALAGAGVVSIGIGAGYGLVAIGRKNDESKYSNLSDQITVYNEAKDAQTIGIVCASVGAAAAGAGIVMLILSGADARVATSSLHVAPTWSPGGGGASLSGSF
jgi:hypothetical protein